MFLKSALRFKLKPAAFHSPCLPPRLLLNQVCFLNCVKKKVEVILSLRIKRNERKNETHFVAEPPAAVDSGV